MVISIVSTKSFELSIFQYFKVGKILRPVKHGHLTLPVYFQINQTNFDFTDKAVLQCDISVVKIVL